MENRKRVPVILLLAVILAFVFAIPTSADEEGVIQYTAENGNMVVIHDAAGLLSEGEKESLLENMKSVTEYGHAAFITINENYESADSYAESRYYKLFGEQSGTLFLIDMDNRMIWFYSDGRFAKLINNTKSNEIATNIYKYASREEYYECANEAFSQVLIILKGGRISTPMRYVTNALMAICLGLLFNFLLVTFNRRRTVSIKKTDTAHVIGGGGLGERTDFIKNVTATMISQRRTRHKESSSGGGGGSSGGGGGGGGGGGSSGGHSF